MREKFSELYTFETSNYFWVDSDLNSVTRIIAALPQQLTCKKQSKCKNVEILKIWVNYLVENCDNHKKSQTYHRQERVKPTSSQIS